MEKMIVPYAMALNVEEVNILKVKKECTLKDAILIIRNKDELRKKLYYISEKKYVKEFVLCENDILYVESFHKDEDNNHYDYFLIERKDYNIILYYYNWRYSYIKYFISGDSLNDFEFNNAYLLSNKIKYPDIKGYGKVRYCEILNYDKIRYTYTMRNPYLLYESEYKEKLIKYWEKLSNNNCINIKSMKVTHDQESFIPLLGHDDDIYYNAQVLITFDFKNEIEEVNKFDILKDIALTFEKTTLIKVARDKRNILVLAKIEDNYKVFTIKLDSKNIISNIFYDDEKCTHYKLKKYIGKKFINKIDKEMLK